MNVPSLVVKYLLARPLNTALNAFMLALGIAVITILMILNRQMQEKLSQNARGIDLVVGAKGSPLQLILCNIFHIDVPTGNIKLMDAERVARNRHVKSAIPLALGDSYMGFRIVGTTRAYAGLYDATIMSGAWWNKDLEVTVGHNVATSLKLDIGDHFVSSHGLTVSGHTHEADHFIVTGVMKQTNSVIDNLILTSVESIWKVHDEHSTPEAATAVQPAGSPPSPVIPSIAAGDSTREITALLIGFRSALGAVQLPRMINASTALQAASPAFESARLFSIMGVGVDIMNGFAVILIFISTLSIFIALYNSLKERKFDLAMMRVMGASKRLLMSAILLEGTILTAGSTAAGVLLGHLATTAMPLLMPELQKAAITGVVFYPAEWIILAASLLLGVICSLVPAVMAYRTDISKVLAKSQ